MEKSGKRFREEVARVLPDALKALCITITAFHHIYAFKAGPAAGPRRAEAMFSAGGLAHNRGIKEHLREFIGRKWITAPGLQSERGLRTGKQRLTVPQHKPRSNTPHRLFHFWHNNQHHSALFRLFLSIIIKKRKAECNDIILWHFPIHDQPKCLTHAPLPGTWVIWGLFQSLVLSSVLA